MAVLEGAAAVHVLRAFIFIALVDSGLPAVASAASELAVCDHEVEMEFGLEPLLDAIRRRIDAQA